MFSCKKEKSEFSFFKKFPTDFALWGCLGTKTKWTLASFKISKLLKRISSSFGCVLAQTIIFLLLINSVLKEKEGFGGSASMASNLSDDST